MPDCVAFPRRRPPLHLGLGIDPVTTVELRCSELQADKSGYSVRFEWPDGDDAFAMSSDEGDQSFAEFRPGRLYTFTIAEKIAPPKESA